MTPARPAKAEITGFQATNQVTVKIRDIAKIGATLDRMVGAGATDVSGIEFSVTDSTQALDKARREAVADARRKAQIYAEAAEVRLGRAILIQEDGAATPGPLRASMMARADSTPVLPGEQTLRASVTISFELMH